DVLAANSASVQNPCRQMLEGQEANLANFSFFFSVNGSSFLSCSSDIGAIVVVNAMRRREEDRRLVVLFYRESEGLVVLQLHGWNSKYTTQSRTLQADGDAEFP